MTNRLLLLGHRGARATKSIPENTLASFDRALADGCDGFEFDVRLTADGMPVVCHDPRTRGLSIARSTAQQLAGPPHLRDVLERYADRAFLDIELKVAGLEKIVLQLLKRHSLRRGGVVSSFLPHALEAIHAQDATIPLGLICETKAQLARWRKLPVGFIIPHRKLLSQDFVGEFKDAGRKLLVWTVNTPSEMKTFAAWGVDGIISDNPKRLAQTFGELER